MHNISLSHDADKILNVIYEKYKSRLSSKNSKHLNTIHTKVFYICSLFPDQDDVIHTLIELSNRKMINFFSDGRIMIRDEAISYIEHCFMEC